MKEKRTEILQRKKLTCMKGRKEANNTEEQMKINK
jgi:hypothetical protein